VAITPNGAFAYVTNQLSNNVSVIDTSANTVVATVAVGSLPRGVAITPNGAFAYVTNRTSNNVSVIDTSANTVVATVAVGSNPFGVAITPNGAFAYVTNNSLSGNVSVIDTSTNTVVATVGVGNVPVGVAITPSPQTIVTTVVDSGPGSLRAAITTANDDGGPNNIVFDPTVFPPFPPNAPPVICPDPHAICLVTPLPTLTGMGDRIDGSGAGVVIDGSALPANSVGLQVRQSNITVKGLTLQNIPSDAIQVRAMSSTPLTGILIDRNTLLQNNQGGGGMRISGGTGPNYSVQATITNNTISDARTGIFVIGNFNSRTSDPGGNTVTVLLDGNTVGASQIQGTSFGTGIGITAGIGTASNNHIIAEVSNNNVSNNQSDGILVSGCGSAGGASGTNNSVDITLTGNTVKNNLDAGIIVTAAQTSGPTCSQNTVTFEISGNTVVDNGVNTTSNTGVNIDVSGGAGIGHNVQGTISNNTIKDDKQWPFDQTLLPPGDGLVVTGGSGTGNTVHDITISGNTVSGTFGLVTKSNIALTPGDGLNVSGGSGTGNQVQDITISGNTVSGNNRGILVNGGSNSHSAVLDGIDVVANTVHKMGAKEFRSREARIR
jgi:YVTN family beta-propeller protein/parallel beta-helix repeat protein